MGVYWGQIKEKKKDKIFEHRTCMMYEDKYSIAGKRHSFGL